MDEDKPRKRDAQLTGLASARRAVRLGARDPGRPTGAVGDFFGRHSPVSH